MCQRKQTDGVTVVGKNTAEDLKRQKLPTNAEIVLK
jgi:hypothetical protein